MKPKHRLLDRVHCEPYKPFRYPWAYDAYKAQRSLHWSPEEVSLADDIKDWKNSLSKSEIIFLTHIFRFFTQADIDVGTCYREKYIPKFMPNEIRMMLVSFAHTESLHIEAYSYLLDTLGLPETEYSVFLQYKAMTDKHDYYRGFAFESPQEIALTLATFAAFGEGLQLFASFVMLLNFPKNKIMNGMGQIITWSVRDEELHVASMCKLWKVFVMEYSNSIDKKVLIDGIKSTCLEMVNLEDSFIDLAFSDGGVRNLEPKTVKLFVRWIANRRLSGLGIDCKLFDVVVNPLPFFTEMTGAHEFVNFFEQKSTTYGDGSEAKDSWLDVK